ncbi:MAG: hypothetical protein JW712_03730 [Dehalococcoidales bacterium]|nr:hypothetical protein [Dehalococcoidales bacterium]
MLALKFPLGKAAWGGKFTVLPVGFRIASACSALLLTFVLLCVLERGGIISLFNSRTFVTVTTWFFTVYFGLNTLMNYRSQSRTEKRIMTPVAFLLFVLFLIVSVTAG